MTSNAASREPTRTTDTAYTAYTTMASPLGTLVLIGRDGILERIRLPGDGRGRDVAMERDDRALAVAVRQLDEYFEGRRRCFEVPLAPRTTAFRTRVLAALERIPYGTTCSYGDLALAAGCPTAARAIGGAVGANPLPIVLPCHRVVGRSGSLTGFGGGLPAKRLLLELEGVRLDDRGVTAGSAAA